MGKIYKKNLTKFFTLGTMLFIIYLGSSLRLSFANDMYYVNNYYGYKYFTNNYFRIDESKSEVVTILSSPNDDIKFYYDNSNSIRSYYDTFNGYGNYGIYSDGDFKVLDSYYTIKSGKRAHVLIYDRRKMNVENDKSHYASITIHMDSSVLTMIISNINPLNRNIINDYLDNLTFIEKSQSPPIMQGKIGNLNHMSDEVGRYYYDNLVNFKGQKFGIYEPTVEHRGDYFELEKLEQTLGYKFAALLSYQSSAAFDNSKMSISRDAYAKKKKLLKLAKKENRLPLFTISTFYTGQDGKFVDRTLDVIEGKCDHVLLNFVDVLKAADIPVMVRINNEMNGDWVPYCSHLQGKDPQVYIQCYRYIHDFFVKNGVKNVIYVFNPNNKSFPDFAFNSYLSYYPGDEYVDVIGLTAYNTGTYYSGETWQSFHTLYDNLYKEYEKRFSQPFIITEFSCSSFGGDKASWMTQMLNEMKNYPRIKYAILWNGQDYDYVNGEKKVSRDYKIDNSPEVISVLSEGLKNY